MKHHYLTTQKKLLITIFMLLTGSYGTASADCYPKDVMCPMIFAPVCGTDGRTYSNMCTAGVACVDIAYIGACEEPPPVCQDQDGDGFSPAGPVDCGPVDCNDRDPNINPDMVCLDIYDPVCGEDGKTYGSTCVALSQCATIAHSGECEVEPICPDTDQDGYSPQGDGSCGPIDCDDNDPTITPDYVCTEEYAPVCGEDGVTYNNGCLARQSCANVAHRGRCRTNRTNRWFR